jgi:ligand-binding sensor domain-containing protein
MSQAMPMPPVLRASAAERVGLALLGAALLSAVAFDEPAPAARAATTPDGVPLQRLFEPVAPGSPGATTVLVAGADGDVWWVTRDAVVRFAGGDPARREPVLDAEVHRARFGRALAPIAAAHVDARGALWLGAREGVVLHHHRGAWRELALAGAGRVRAIATSRDALWVGARGLWQGTLDGGALEAQPGFARRPIDHVASDGGERVAVAVGSDVWLRNGVGHWRHVRHGGARDGRVSELGFTPAGELWIGTTRGLLRRDAAGRLHRELGGAHIDALAADAAGATFVGTRGAGLFTRYARGWRRIDAADGPALRRVRALAPGPHGTLWLALGGRGLVRAGG